MAITYDQLTVERLWGTPEHGYSRAFWQAFKPSADASPRFWKDLWDQRIVPAIGNVTGAQRILFVGCGLGMGVESAIDSGFVARSCWGIDNSAYMQSLWPTEARADLRPGSQDPKLGALDVRTVTNTQLRTLTGLGGNVRFTIIITDDMLSSYTQAELASANVAVNPLVAIPNWLAAGGKIIHLMWTMDGSTPDMTRWPANAQIPDPLPNPPTPDNPGGGATPAPWAGTPMSSPGSPAMTMAQWQALRPAPHQFVSMEGI